MRWAARDRKASKVGAAAPGPGAGAGAGSGRRLWPSSNRIAWFGRRSPLLAAMRRHWGSRPSGVKVAKWRRLRAEAEEPQPLRLSSYRCTATRALDAWRRGSSTPASQVTAHLEARYHTTGLLLFRGYALTCLRCLLLVPWGR